MTGSRFSPGRSEGLSEVERKAERPSSPSGLLHIRPALRRQCVTARSDDNGRKGIAMREKLVKALLMLVVLLVLPGLAWSQDAQQNLTLIVTGQPGQAAIVQMNGKSYLDIQE